MARTLTYSLIDDLELACQAGMPLPTIDVQVRSLGPLIQLRRSSGRQKIFSGIAIDPNNFAAACDFIDDPSGTYVNSSGSLGIAAASDDSDNALELMQRALLAIKRSTLPEAAAAQAVSALGELEANIHEHSEDSTRGFVAYEVQEDFVGLYASDLGIGVRASLSRNQTYSELDDSGEALRLALQEGVSRTNEPGRGMGFRPIFVGLAGHCGLLRFRSGEALLELVGFGDKPTTQDLKERAPVAGFHAFVHCTFSPAKAKALFPRNH